MDALGEILRTMRLSGGVFLDGEFTEPWCIKARVEPEDCLPFMPTPARLIAYHYVIEGHLVLQVDGHAPVRAAGGELLVLPRNDVHLLGSAPDLTPADPEALIQPAEGGGLARIRFGGGGGRTRILCGFLGSDDPGDPLLGSLPPVVKLVLGDRPVGPWIESSIRYAVGEIAAGGEGASSCLARMAELLFAEAVREYVKTLPADQAGWPAGLRDPYVARALVLMHSRPEHPWTLKELAQAVGLSRSAFSERFLRRIRLSPMRYLCRQRLQRAAERLRQSRIPVSRIAFEAGYESEAAFTRAFKREFGVAPGAFRRERARA